MYSKQSTFKNYNLYQMEKEDFTLVKDFLDRQREKLDRIEFFYPYKDSELAEVLDKGYFLGLFDGQKLIATFAIDYDEDYAKQIADIINSSCDIGLDRAYESSGLMVDEDYRGQGIAGFLMDKICVEASRKNINICGVVQICNAASMNTFFSRGFELRGLYSMGGVYDFGYLLRRAENTNLQNMENFSKLILQSPSKYDIIVDVEREVSNSDIATQRRMLAEGYYGIHCDKKRIFYIRDKERKL